MVDYKELIERLKRQGSVTTYKEKTICGDCKDAATAIETLLEERDAAAEELHGRCSLCKYFHTGPLELPCTDCKFESGTSDRWEWRGPKKGDAT